ncbi:glycosyltransferase family 4 protein [Gottfriedia sp. NPDC058432]|uniref:glycosyltransferase family 4 protein n=1 Tax=Gottfriedia sp. NPDC058432 TaxID=3346497 RepID=UPI00365C316C
MSKEMRIGYISMGDSYDTNTWSGTTYYFAENLEKLVQLERISICDDNVTKLINKYYSLKSKITKKRYIGGRSKLACKYYSLKAKKSISKIGNLDAIISVGTLPIVYLDIDIPIINYTDATFNQMVDYYSEFSNLSYQTINDSNKLERKALEKSSLLFYCSTWAKESAVNDYNIAPNKVFSIPFGLNMSNIPHKDEVSNEIEKKLKISKCNLVFVGKDYKRKGGEIAYSTVRYLNEKLNIDAHLTIIGSSPKINDTRVSIIPYIDKNIEEQQKLYQNILNESHFLILPTKADCFSMVGIEANANGIPVVTTNTGGLPSLIEEGINGFQLDVEEDSKAYSLKIYENFIDKEKYRKLCINSRNHYEQKTNWLNTCSYIVNKISEKVILKNKK